MEANMALLGRGLPDNGRPAEDGLGGLPADPGRDPGLVWLGLRTQESTQ